MNTESNSEKPESAVACTGLLAALRRHLKDMDAQVRMKRVAIREAAAAADQMEADKLALEIELDRIEKQITANDRTQQRRENP